MNINECFRVLEVPPSASPDAIRRSYRTLVNVWHPDRFVGNETLRLEAERKLALINQAFNILEAAGFPQGDVQEPAATAQAISRGGETAEPISRPVQTTVWATSVVVLSFLFWLGLNDRALIERLTASVFAGLLAGSALSTMLFHVVWSVKARPRTWIIMLGTSVVAVVWLLDSNPSLGPVLLVVGFLGALLLVFVLFYLHSRPSQSAQTQIWNRLVVSGFLIMLALAGSFVFFSLPTLAIAVSWLFWFGWTWISWLIAGRIALRKANVVTSQRA